MDIRNDADRLIEAPVVTSFSRMGFELRSRLDHWTSLDSVDLTDRVVVITGGTSGIGRAAAEQLARCGATLVVVGRAHDRNALVAAEIAEASGSDRISHHAADMGDYEQVRQLAERVLVDHTRLDVLIHNAGALSAVRHLAPDGTEATVASQVVGPFLLTTLLLERLVDTAGARVLTMSSGGMYTARLHIAGLEMGSADYRGSEQYARAKRAQVTLNELWAARFGSLGVTFHALHPGWVDTPGVDAALPRFAKAMGPFLRSPAQGADTLVWLAGDPEALGSNGLFWLDRRPRPIHKLARTRASDTPERRTHLWRWVAERAGVDPAIDR